jgi:CubicO group peptidase (beta-lactamase class C family)
MSMFDYAREKLFGPLGISDVKWDADPQGITRGWGDLHLLPEDMVKLGALWLAGGAWDGKQLIPADWLKAATTEAIRSDRYEDYGYGFWIGPKGEPIAYFMASGRGGQRITVIRRSTRCSPRPGRFCWRTHDCDRRSAGRSGNAAGQSRARPNSSPRPH